MTVAMVISATGNTRSVSPPKAARPATNMSSWRRVTGRKFERTASTSLRCSASPGCTTWPSGSNITARVSQLRIRCRFSSRFSQCAKCGPVNSIMSISMRSEPALAPPDRSSARLSISFSGESA
jgi:hypothetical protein